MGLDYTVPLACILGQVASKRLPPLTVLELQEMARNCTMQTERRLLWEVSRLRRIALQAHELDILLTDERMLGQDVQLTRVAKALRDMLKDEPVIAERVERHEAYLFQQRLRGRNPI